MQRVRIRGLLPLALVLSLVVPVAQNVFAADDRGSEIGFLVGAGFGDKNLVGDKDGDPNPLVGVRFGNLFADHWGFFIDGTYVPYNGEIADSDAITARAGL